MHTSPFTAWHADSCWVYKACATNGAWLAPKRGIEFDTVVCPGPCAFQNCGKLRKPQACHLIAEECAVSLASLYRLQERKASPCGAGGQVHIQIGLCPPQACTGQSITLFFFRKDCSCPNDHSVAFRGIRTRVYYFTSIIRNLSYRCFSMAVPAFPDHNHQLYYWMFPRKKTNKRNFWIGARDMLNAQQFNK